MTETSLLSTPSISKTPIHCSTATYIHIIYRPITSILYPSVKKPLFSLQSLKSTSLFKNFPFLKTKKPLTLCNHMPPAPAPHDSIQPMQNCRLNSPFKSLFSQFSASTAFAALKTYISISNAHISLSASNLTSVNTDFSPSSFVCPKLCIPKLGFSNLNNYTCTFTTNML